MRRAVVLHGMPSKEEYYDVSQDSPSNAHWLPWLQHQLLTQDILAQTPEMPEPYDPDYENWRREFEKYTINEQTILVGHSCGGGFLVRWLSESDTIVGKLILVAPWLDRERENGDLFQFEIDTDLGKKTRRGVDVLYSTNDDVPIQTSLEFLRQSLPAARYHEFVDYGHFCLKDMSTREFPELLSICLKEVS